MRVYATPEPLAWVYFVGMKPGLAYASTSDTLTIEITGEIGYMVNFADVKRLLDQADGREVHFEISSGGGLVFDALAIYDYVRTKGLVTHTRVYGLSASAATIIGAASGRNRTSIGANSFYFVHRAHGGDQATLNKINERLTLIYMELSGLSRKKVTELMDAGDKGAFLTASEAMEAGFVGSLMEAMKAAAHYVELQKRAYNTIEMEQEKVETATAETKPSLWNTIKKALNITSEDVIEIPEGDEHEVIASAVAELKAATATIDELKAEVEAKVEEVKASTDKVAEMTTATTEVEAKVKTLGEERDALSTKLEALTKEVEDLRKLPTVKASVLAEEEVVVQEPGAVTEPVRPVMTEGQQRVVDIATEMRERATKKA